MELQNFELASKIVSEIKEIDIKLSRLDYKGKVVTVFIKDQYKEVIYTIDPDSKEHELSQHARNMVDGIAFDLKTRKTKLMADLSIL